MCLISKMNMSSFHIHDSCYLLSDRLNCPFVSCIFSIMQCNQSIFQSSFIQAKQFFISSFLTPSGIVPKPLILSVLLFRAPSTSTALNPKWESHTTCIDLLTYGEGLFQKVLAQPNYFFFFQTSFLNADSMDRYQSKGAVVPADVKVQQVLAGGQSLAG